MEVILLEHNRHLGPLGSKVKVAAGYARNYLIPQKKAVPATAQYMESFEKQRAELESRAAEQKLAAEALFAHLHGLTAEIKMRVGKEGRLYGAVHTVDVVQAVQSIKPDVIVDRKSVYIPSAPIRAVGEYSVELHLHPGVTAQMTLVVSPQ